MRTDSRIQSDSFNNLFRIQAAHLRISVKLVEICDTERKIGIGKQLDGLSLGRTGIQNRNILFLRALAQQFHKLFWRGRCPHRQ